MLVTPSAAKHVVDGNGKSQIITYDQDRHQATSTVVAKGVDLAVVRFNSKNDYSVAKLNEYSPNDDDLVFVGGFPGRDRINSPLWQWQLNPGFVYSREQGKLETQNKLTFADKYNLLYSSNSYGGMSGGPVFDRSGSIIGIHGKAEGQNLNSAGISIQTFTGLLKELQVNYKLLSVTNSLPKELKAEDNKNIREAMQNIFKPEGLDEDGLRSLAYGTQLYRVRKYEAAVDAFKIAITKGKSKNSLLSGNYRKALVLSAIGEYQAAADAIAKAIDLVKNNKKDSENNYYLWKTQSDIFRFLGNYTLSLESINKAIFEEGKDVNYRKNNDWVLHNQKAVLLSELGNKQEAIDEYTAIINEHPEASAYNNRGATKANLGDDRGAIRDYDQAIILNSNFAMAYNNRGNAEARLMKKEIAIKDYDRAITLNPRYADAYYDRGMTKSNSGDNQGAIEDYDRAITLNPKNADFYGNRGFSKHVLKDNRAAIKDYDQAITLNPKFYKAYNDRGAAKSELGDKKGAIIDYDRAIILNPKYADAYYNRGNVKYTVGDKQAAIEDYSQAILFNSKDSIAYYNRGVTKSELGDKQAAIKDYDQAITLNSKYAQAYLNRGNAKYTVGQKQSGIQDMKTAAELFRQQGQIDLYQKVMDLIK